MSPSNNGTCYIQRPLRMADCQPAALRRRWSSRPTMTKQTATVQSATVWMKHQNHMWLHNQICNRLCVSQLNSSCNSSFQPATLNTGVSDLFMLTNILSILSGYILSRNVNFKRFQSILKIISLRDVPRDRKRPIQLNSLSTSLELGHTIQSGRVSTLLLLLPWHWELIWSATSAGKRCSGVARQGKYTQYSARIWSLLCDIGHPVIHRTSSNLGHINILIISPTL